MFKIMLADDEGIVIDSLRFLITKEFGDEVEIEYAKTGRNVIELAERFRPDIAVMDIQMPGINGLDAMREIRARDENVVFIVLSAFDKFDYAAQALKLGAIEYLTKPMERTKMIETLRKAMDRVTAERNRRADRLMIREKLETVIPLLESSFLYHLLTRESDEEDLRDYRTLLDFKSDYAYMMVLTAGDEKIGGQMTNAVGSGIRLQSYTWEIREIIKLFFDSASVCVIGSEIVVLCPYTQENFGYGDRLDVIQRARETARKLHERTDARFRVGIGSAGTLRHMAESYNDALNALRMTTNTVAHTDDFVSGSADGQSFPIDAQERFLEAVERGRFEAASAAARELCGWTASLPLMDARLKLLELILKADEIADRSGSSVSADRSDYLPALMAAETHTALWDWCEPRIFSACMRVQNRQSAHSNGVIDAAKDYIEANFSKSITLEDVSREVNISPYYFSRIFKETIGENFIDYLTNLRLEKAKTLLGTTGFSMKEICAMSGYSDPNYFSKIFKKNVGMTPTEYREGRL